MDYFTIRIERRELVELLTDEQAGRLLKALFEYVASGSELELDQPTRMAFVSLRQTIDANAARYAEICEKRAAAGRSHTGNQYTRVEQNGTNGTNVPTLEQNGTNGTKTKTKTKTNITKEKEKEKEKTQIAATAVATFSSKEVRAKKFYDSLVDYVGKYGAQMVREFYDYWTESNAGGARMRFEMEKVFDVSRRLATWANRDKQFNTKSNGQRNYQTATERSRAEYLDALGRILAK